MNMDDFDLDDDDFDALMEPDTNASWLAAFDAGLRRAGVADEQVALRHDVDQALLDDARLSAELRERASVALLDDATLEALSHQPNGVETLTLARLATVLKWAAQYEVLAAVGRLDESVFHKAVQYAMEAGGFADPQAADGTPGDRP